MEGVFLTHGNTFLFNDCTDEFPVSNSDIYVSHSKRFPVRIIKHIKRMDRY